MVHQSEHIGLDKYQPHPLSFGRIPKIMKPGRPRIPCPICGIVMTTLRCDNCDYMYGE